MHKLTLLLLLATAAAPAMAQDSDQGGRRHRGDSSEQSDSSPQREARSPEARSAGGQRSGGDQRGAIERVREHRLQTGTTTTATTSTPSDRDDIVRVRRGGGDGTSAVQPSTNWRERERRVRTIPDTQPSATRPLQVERDGLQSHSRRDYRDGRYTRWSDHWRRDRRYDWTHYRSRNRSLFHLGFYYDPFGWNYRRWSIGSLLYPSYYGSSFWLNDPWQYRLPTAYGPYRWVRYWNDALLVNIYTGEVVDVVHGFFW
jgi:hypothetical protein